MTNMNLMPKTIRRLHLKIESFVRRMSAFQFNFDDSSKKSAQQQKHNIVRTKNRSLIQTHFQEMATRHFFFVSILIFHADLLQIEWMPKRRKKTPFGAHSEIDSHPCWLLTDHEKKSRAKNQNMYKNKIWLAYKADVQSEIFVIYFLLNHNERAINARPMRWTTCKNWQSNLSLSDCQMLFM